MPNTTINTLPYPDGAGAASVALYFQQLAQALDTKVPGVFATAAARDAAIPAPTSGMQCVTAGRLLLYRAGAWAKQGGPRELLYENGNSGSSGVVNAGAGPTGVLSVNVPAAGVAADTAHAHVVLGLKSTGTTVGSLILTVAGQSIAAQIFALDSTASIPITLEMPVTIPAATFSLGVSLNPSSGNSCQVSYSSIRLTF